MRNRDHLILFILIALPWGLSHELLASTPHSGGRLYISQVLHQIFGHSSEVNKIIYNNITSKIQVFGDPCVLHEQIMVNKFFVINPIQDCQQDLSNTKVEMFKFSTPYRASWTIKACEELTAMPKAIEHALGLIKSPQLKSLDEIPVTQESISKAFQLFYPLDQPNQKIIQSLKELTQDQFHEFNSGFEIWRWVFFALCSSGYWQLL